LVSQIDEAFELPIHCRQLNIGHMQNSPQSYRLASLLSHLRLRGGELCLHLYQCVLESQHSLLRSVEFRSGTRIRVCMKYFGGLPIFVLQQVPYKRLHG